MKRRSTCLSIFLKAPIAGQVKTRLGRTVGQSRATELYRAFVIDTLRWVATARISERRVDFAPAGGRTQCEALTESRLSRFTFCPQTDGDLGKRMAATFRSMFQCGHERCVIIGTDCPTLGPRVMTRAFHALEDADLVLGPTYDGGYYLIGLRRNVPQLFERVPWSTERVLKVTTQRAAACGLRTALLPPLRDIDTEADLAALKAELLERWRGGEWPFPRRTLQVLEWEFAALTGPEGSPADGRA